MSIKIALLADLCGKNAEALYREFAEIVFLRTLHYLNSQIQPDAVVLTGSAEKLTEKQLAAVREASAEFKMPFLSMTPGIKGLPSPVVNFSCLIISKTATAPGSQSICITVVKQSLPIHLPCLRLITAPSALQNRNAMCRVLTEVSLWFMRRRSANRLTVSRSLRLPTPVKSRFNMSNTGFHRV